MPDKLIYGDLDSPLGPMVAGASDKGVSFLEWHDRGGLERISARVRKRYRCELIDGRNEHLAQLERELADYFDRTLTRFTVPIDITGTAFEQRVWQELLQIPYGQTRSYGEVARLLGSPGGSRAVGRANGANYLAIVIPCHRVIDANGNLHGYGGKVWRKKALLELEAGVAAMNL